MAAKEKVAFLGAGQMGGRCATLLINDGYPVTIYDPAPAVQKEFAAKGAAVAESADACADADTVVVFVMSGPQALDAVLGKGGLLSGMTRRAPSRLIVMSTISPEDVLKIAAALKDKGTRVIDAPVTGGLTLAEQRRLTLLVGGDAADVDASEPFLLRMSEKILRCGPLGAGQTAKILNNLMACNTVQLMLETYRLGVDYGITPEVLGGILQQGTGANFYAKDPQDAVNQYDYFSKDPEYFKQVWGGGVKDLNLAQSLADSRNIYTPFLSGAINTFLTLDRQRHHAGWRAFVQSQKKPG